MLTKKDLTYDKIIDFALGTEVEAKDTKDLLATSNVTTGFHYTAIGGINLKNQSGRATQPNY